MSKIFFLNFFFEIKVRSEELFLNNQLVRKRFGGGYRVLQNGVLQ